MTVRAYLLDGPADDVRAWHWTWDAFDVEEAKQVLAHYLHDRWGWGLKNDYGEVLEAHNPAWVDAA